MKKKRTDIITQFNSGEQGLVFWLGTKSKIKAAEKAWKLIAFFDLIDAEKPEKKVKK